MKEQILILMKTTIIIYLYLTKLLVHQHKTGHNSVVQTQKNTGTGEHYRNVHFSKFTENKKKTIFLIKHFNKHTMETKIIHSGENLGLKMFLI